MSNPTTETEDTSIFNFCNHVTTHTDDARLDPPEDELCTEESEFLIQTSLADNNRIESCGKHLREMIPDDGAWVSPILYNPRIDRKRQP